jgi:hypothetical protein
MKVLLHFPPHLTLHNYIHQKNCPISINKFPRPLSLLKSLLQPFQFRNWRVVLLFIYTNLTLELFLCKVLYYRFPLLNSIHQQLLFLYFIVHCIHYIHLTISLKRNTTLFIIFSSYFKVHDRFILGLSMVCFKVSNKKWGYSIVASLNFTQWYSF